MGKFSSRIYLPSATYLNSVIAEFFSVGLFFFFVLPGWGSILSCCCADTNTTHSMGTAALRRRFYCCWCCYYTTARVNAAKNFRRWCRHYVAVFTAVGAAITLWRGQMLLKFSPLVPALRFFCRGYGRLRSCTTGTLSSLGKRLR